MYNAREHDAQTLCSKLEADALKRSALFKRALQIAFTNRKLLCIMVLVATYSMRRSAHNILKENTMGISYFQTLVEILPNVIDFVVALATYLAPLSSAA